MAHRDTHNGNPVTDSLPRINKTLWAYGGRSTTFLSLSFAFYLRLPSTVEHESLFDVFSYSLLTTGNRSPNEPDRCWYFGGFPRPAAKVSLRLSISRRSVSSSTAYIDRIDHVARHATVKSGATRPHTALREFFRPNGVVWGKAIERQTTTTTTTTASEKGHELSAYSMGKIVAASGRARV